MFLNSWSPNDELRKEGKIFKNPIVERVWCDSTISRNKQGKMISLPNETVYWLGIFKTDNVFYAVLQCNWDSSYINLLYDRAYECGDEASVPRDGVVELTESEAMSLIARLEKMNFDNQFVDVCDYSLYMDALVATSPCSIYFDCERENNWSPYRSKSKHITVKIAQTGAETIATTIYEIAHAFFNKLKVVLILDNEDYYTHEFICKTIAYNVIQNIIKSNEHNGTILEAFELLYHREELKIKRNKKIDSAIKLITEKITTGIENYINNPHTGTEERNYYPSFIPLNEADNKSLFDIIINEIAPKIPPEDEEDEYDEYE